MHIAALGRCAETAVRGVLTHSSDSSGLSDVPRRTQIEMLNAQLLSFLRVFVDVPDHGDCLFDALIHLWNAEVGVNAPEAPWIEADRIRGLSEEAIQGSDAHQLLRDAMVDEMQAQLRQGTEATEEAVTFRADDAEKYRTQGPWGDEDCMLPLTRVLRANITRVVPAQPVKLDLHYQYRDDNAKPSEYTLVCLVSNHHPSIETRRHIKLTRFS